MMNQFKITLSPVELILERSRAFGRANFGFIFDSFHSGSNFRRQFTSRSAYITFGRENLEGNFRILNCRVLADDLLEDEARVIFLLDMVANDVRQTFAELAWLRREEGGWRYHRGLKITGEDLPEKPEELGFADFEKLDQRLVF